MIATPGDLIREIESVDANSDVPLRVMLNVGGRWTGIKGITVDYESAVLFVESED